MEGRSAWEKVGGLVEAVKESPELRELFADGAAAQKIEKLQEMGFAVEDIQALAEGAEALSPKGLGPGWWMW